MAQILYPNELQTPELVLEFLDYAPHPILRTPTYFFRMIEPATGAKMGRINLRASHAAEIEHYAGHIGYEVELPYQGRGYAAKAVRMLFPLAARLGLRPLWLTCDPENMASRRTCEKAGGVLVETVTLPADSSYSPLQQKCRYRFDVAL